MKKLFTLLLLALTVFTHKSEAQAGTVCNADFNSQFLTATTVKFTPVVLGDSISTSHYWTFGDGINSNIPIPTHTYGAGGTYNVKHIIIKRNPNGVEICRDSMIKTLQIQGPCNLVANFTWYNDSINVFTVHFQNTSNPLDPTDSIRWTFGDGTSSLDVNPVHSYANAGVYTVCLRVKKNNSPPGTTPCVKEICKQVTVQSPTSCNLIAYFTWHADSLNSLKIWFNNQSIGASSADSIRWTFGDGTSSNNYSPDHIYAQPGTYTVCLRIIKRNNVGGLTNCISDICKTVIVQAPTSCSLQAYFIWHADSVNAQKIWFTNQTVGIATGDSIRWTFGDGTSSKVFSPDHIYAQSGTYTVCLRVIKRGLNGGLTNCISEICKTVIVGSNCTLIVNWNWHADSINTRKIYFNNLTVSTVAGATATWTFGDGAAASSWNAVHEYAQPGYYRVCLRVILNNTCVREKCDTILVVATAPPCNNQSNFAFEKFTNDNQQYKFIPAYQNPTAIYTWTFGDGTGSHDMIAVHRYAQPGTYTTCLTVWRSATCASTTCRSVVVQAQLDCNAIQVTYNYQKDPFVPNKVYFYAISNFPILDQTWTIRRMPLTAAGTPIILHQNNPVFVFQDTGYYQVCLRAITLGGCIKEYCNIIHIEQVAPQCVLQAYPNPATSLINVNVALTQPEMIHVYIYNTLNVLVKEKHQQGNTGNNLVSIPIADLLSGMYNMKVVYGNKTCTARFQKI